eukprot:Gb_06018 [translate_table: standard]
MRIRKRWDVSSSSSPSPNTRNYSSNLMGAQEEKKEGHPKKVGWDSDVEVQEQKPDCIRVRRNNWRKALLDSGSNTVSEVEWQGKCIGIMRKQGKNLGAASNEAKYQEQVPKQVSSSICEEVITGNEFVSESLNSCHLTGKQKRGKQTPPSDDDQHMSGRSRSKLDRKLFMNSKKTRRETMGCAEIKDDVGAEMASVMPVEMKEGKNLVIISGNKNRAMPVGLQCRRMNGRGWRCSQPTLVGYALCEHHLGKGRLMSINNGYRIRVNEEMKAKDSQTTILSESDDSPSAEPLQRQLQKKRAVKARSLKLITL